jgi:hypothetical protein
MGVKYSSLTPPETLKQMSEPPRKDGLGNEQFNILMLI